MSSVSIGKEYEQKKQALRKSRAVDLRYFSVKEADHFFGWDVITSIGKDLEYVPDGMGEELPFHCEVKLHQVDSETGTSFRSTCTRIKQGEISSFEHDGVPAEMLDYYKQRSLIIYRIIYPDGITLEEIQEQ